MLSRARRRRRAAAGFTLIEVMVALVIGGVLLSLAGLSVKSADRSLQTDSNRIALLLGLARDEAQLRGAPIRFVTDENSYEFLIRRAERWVPLLDDRTLRGRDWGGVTDIEMRRDDGREVIEFGRDTVGSPFELVLMRGEQRATIIANGLGVFEVKR